MGKIQDAQAEVARIEAEIADLHKQLRARTVERARIRDSVDPDDAIRAGALESVIEKLKLRLPVRGRQLGDWASPVQHRLIKAKSRLENLRRERYNLAREVERLEEQREALARLPEIRAAIDKLYTLCSEAGSWVPELDSARLHRARNWCESTKYNLNTVLPNLRARVAQYGDDDWQPPSTWHKEIDAAIANETRQARATQARLTRDGGG